MDEFTQVTIEFNATAAKIFFSLYQRFNVAVKDLDRQRDDNVFQQQQGKYLQALKNQLEFLAQELLTKNTSLKNNSQLNKKLTEEINQYLNEFRQKSRSM